MTIDERASFRKRFASGAIGAFVTSLVVLPFDVVKVRQQAECPVHGNAPNSLEMFRKILQRQGIRGAYVGLAPTLVMSVPNAAIYYSCYEELQARLREKFHSSPWNPLVAGGSARLLASTVTAPLEFLRTAQAAAHSSSNLSSSAYVKQVLQQEGSSAFFRGLGPTLWRDVPFSAIYWMSLEHMRELWPEESRGSIAKEFCNGAVAGAVACCFTTPFDVIKTMQQSRVLTCCEDAVLPTNGGIVTQLMHVASNQGVSGLWRGNSVRMIKVVPACAIMISSYELGKKLL